jgi:hypothetical protein
MVDEPISENEEGIQVDDSLDELEGKRFENHFVDEAYNIAAELLSENNDKDEYQPKQQDSVPTRFLIARTINDCISMRMLRVLFDSGGTGCQFHSRVLPKRCTPRLLKNPIRSTTVAGTIESKAVVYMKDIVLNRWTNSACL